MGDYIENAKQLVEEDNRNNFENRIFFIFGTNNGFRFDVVLRGSLQYDFIKEFLQVEYETYQAMIDDFFSKSDVQPIGTSTYNNQEYFLYNFGTICEIKFPVTELKIEDRFSLLLFANSKRNENANIVGDVHTLGNIKNVWKYMREKRYTNKRILIPLLGTGCSNTITYKKSIKAIIDAFFDDINNNSIPAFKEIIISIQPEKIGSNIDLLEIERYIELKKLFYK